ncbi:hypothetical protein Tco_0898452 [Tanacetum coccineum]
MFTSGCEVLLEQMSLNAFYSTAFMEMNLKGYKRIRFQVYFLSLLKVMANEDPGNKLSNLRSEVAEAKGAMNPPFGDPSLGYEEEAAKKSIQERTIEIVTELVEV